MGNEYELNQIFGERPTPFYPCIAKATGSIEAAVLLGHLLSLSAHVDWAPVERSHELAEKLGMGEEALLLARDHLMELGILEGWLKVNPVRISYLVIIEKLLQLVRAKEWSDLRGEGSE